MKAAFSFWKRNVQGLPGVDEGQFGVTTNAINGASECSGPNQSAATKRFEIYKKVRKAFKLKGNVPQTEKGCYELNQFIQASNSFTEK